MKPKPVTIAEINHRINSSSSLEELRHQYHLLVREIHPDEHEDNSLDNTRLTQYTNELYETRKQYLRNNLSQIDAYSKFINFGIPEIYYHDGKGIIANDKYWMKRNFKIVDKIIIPKSVSIIGRNAFRNVRWHELEFEQRDDTPIEIASGAFSQYKDFYVPDHSMQLIINMPKVIKFEHADKYPVFNHARISCFQTFKTHNLLPSMIYPQVEWVALNDITEIKVRAFMNCTSLKRVTDTENVTSIEYHAFTGCRSLEELVLPNISNVGVEAFANCPNLKITIPTDRLSLFEKAFGDSLENHKHQFILK